MMTCLGSKVRTLSDVAVAAAALTRPSGHIIPQTNMYAAFIVFILLLIDKQRGCKHKREVHHCSSLIGQLLFL